MNSLFAVSSLPFCAALLVTVVICVFAKKIGTKIGVMDRPDHSRKFHLVATPQIGGIALLAGLTSYFVTHVALVGTLDKSLSGALLFGGIGAGFLGFLDDRTHVPPIWRITGLVALLLGAFVLDPNLIAHSLHWGKNEQTFIAPASYFLLMAITAAGLVNAINMADGQNGLVTSLFPIWFACLFVSSHGDIASLALILVALSLIVFAFNLAARLFLGDAGTYGITFVLGLLIVAAHAQAEISLRTVIVWFAIPVLDCFRLMVARPARGCSPFRADRDHLHHRLVDSIGRTWTSILYTGTVALTSVIATVYPTIAWPCLFLAVVVYFFALAISALTVRMPSVPSRDIESLLNRAVDSRHSRAEKVKSTAAEGNMPLRSSTSRLHS